MDKKEEGISRLNRRVIYVLIYMTGLGGGIGIGSALFTEQPINLTALFLGYLMGSVSLFFTTYLLTVVVLAFGNFGDKN